MSERHLFLLSPYRLPTSHQIYLNEDEMAAWLNGYTVLWHPALLLKAAGPPKIDSSYDHDFPNAGEVYAVPEAPPLFQPDDWADRVENAGALRFRCGSDRTETIAALKAAVQASTHFSDPETRGLLELPLEKFRPFFAVGFGYLMLESLFDAMEHEHLLAMDEFWNHVKQAAQALLKPEGDAEVRNHLEEAVKRLTSAREVLYPINIYLLDIAIIDPDQKETALPPSLDYGFPLNLLASGVTLRKLAAEQPEIFATIKKKLDPDIQPPLLEVVGGVHREREDALLSLESQLWNLRKGRAEGKALLNTEINVYARKRTAFHPQTPQFLQVAGLQQALIFNFDSAVIPNHRAVVVNWPAPDGKSINAFTRMPLPAHSPQTFFNLVYHLHQAITQDSAPTFALMHQGQAASPLYEDWLTLNKFGHVLGQWITFSRYFSEALAGDYTGPANADDFFNDYLEERINAKRPDPVSAFPRHARLRRRIDAVWTLAAVYRGLHTAAPTEAELASLVRLREVEDALETEGLDFKVESESTETDLLAPLEIEWSERLASRLQVHAADNQPGYLLLNPCAFPRRIALELDDVKGPLPLDAPLKAAQFDADKARLVVEVPALGFAWIPKIGKPGTQAPKARIRLADGNTIRNEFFEAEIDPATGCLRAFRDPRTRISRVAQQLVFNPGSRVQARSVQLTIQGAALGEIVTEGDLFDEQNQLLATFRQRFRAWLGRPVLDIRVEIEPKHFPTGYPWHAYYGMRFAWREEYAVLMRSVHGSAHQTHHTRPLSPDYLELRDGKRNLIFLTGGLPYHQRHGARMLDIVLIPEGEKGQVFEIALALDREVPVQPAVGMISPISVVPTTKGPPHIGPTGWLFHLDSPNLVLSTIRPVEGVQRAFVLTLLETSGFGGSAELRCVRNPVRGYLLDASDGSIMEYRVEDNAVKIEYAGNDLLRIRVDFE
jgi:hypothetical protein